MPSSSSHTSPFHLFSFVILSFNFEYVRLYLTVCCFAISQFDAMGRNSFPRSVLSGFCTLWFLIQTLSYAIGPSLRLWPSFRVLVGVVFYFSGTSALVVPSPFSFTIPFSSVPFLFVLFWVGIVCPELWWVFWWGRFFILFPPFLFFLLFYLFTSMSENYVCVYGEFNFLWYFGWVY